jgi:hypothetical protein
MAAPLFGMMNPYVIILPIAILAVVVLAISVLVGLLLWWACRAPKKPHPGKRPAEPADRPGPRTVEWSGEGRTDRSAW